MAIGKIECILASLMAERGVTRQELSSRTGIPIYIIQSYMWQVNISKIPNMQNAVLIAAYFGVTVEYIWRQV